MNEKLISGCGYCSLWGGNKIEVFSSPEGQFIVLDGYRSRLVPDAFAIFWDLVSEIENQQREVDEFSQGV